MYGRKKFTSIDEARLDIFLKKYKPNKNDNVLKGNIRKIDGGCWPPYFWVLQEKILQTTLVGDICHNTIKLSGTECDSDLDIYILTVMKNNISV